MLFMLIWLPAAATLIVNNVCITENKTPLSPRRLVAAAVTLVLLSSNQQIFAGYRAKLGNLCIAPLTSLSALLKRTKAVDELTSLLCSTYQNPPKGASIR
jgi:hypothetical protein